MFNFFKPVAVVVIITIIIMLTHYLGWLTPVEGLVVRAASPIQSRLYNTVNYVGSLKANWLTRRDLLSENKQLRHELEQAYIDRTKLNSLAEENSLLKQELGFAQDQSINTVAATIIGGVSDPLSKSIIINRGRNDQLTEGLAVVTGNGIMIGKVIEVADTYSKVLLLIDNKSKVAATIQNLDRTAGLVEGQFGLNFAMTNIPQDQEIVAGDLIVTSGLEGNIPKNLPIARVVSINQTESNIFKTAVLSPLASFADLSHVLVITP